MRVTTGINVSRDSSDGSGGRSRKEGRKDGRGARGGRKEEMKRGVDGGGSGADTYVPLADSHRHPLASKTRGTTEISTFQRDAEYTVSAVYTNSVIRSIAVGLPGASRVRVSIGTRSRKLRRFGNC